MVPLFDHACLLPSGLPLMARVLAAMARAFARLFSSTSAICLFGSNVLSRRFLSLHSMASKADAKRTCVFSYISVHVQKLRDQGLESDCLSPRRRLHGHLRQRSTPQTSHPLGMRQVILRRATLVTHPTCTPFRQVARNQVILWHTSVFVCLWWLGAPK